MIQSLTQSAIPFPVAAPARPGMTDLRLPSHQISGRAAFGNDTSSFLTSGDRLRLPGFLTSRIGLPWTEILEDLNSVTRSAAGYRRMLHVLQEFVETSVIGSSEKPLHGTGLLIGQPLTAGWRRRLYVCPESDRLLRIP